MAIEGKLTAEGLKIALVVSRFNDFITRRLEEGARDAIVRLGGDADDIAVFRTPGAFEIPLVTQKLCRSGKFDAVVCLGAVIRGSTKHNEYISSEVVKGIANVQLQTGVVVSFGVLTPETIEQAVERAGTKHGNKGFEAATAAIETVNLLREIDANV